MKTSNRSKASQLLFKVSMAFIIYMPLHVFISQSASLVTGGLDAWKAAKDVLLFVLFPVLLYASYRRGLWQDRTFRWLLILAAGYALLHMLFVLFDGSDDTYSAVVGSVFNARLLGYLLLGYVVGSAKNGNKYLQYVLTATVLVATAVAAFGVAQYFLPTDLLTDVGYTLERGVKPLFFIDDKPDLPRVMSTLKDPNSLGAFLIIPILLTGYALFKRKANEALFIRPFRREVLIAMLPLQITALLFTFSRGALVALALSVVTLLFVATGAERIINFIKRFWILFAALAIVLVFAGAASRDTYLVQNIVFHADESTVLADPNEKRVAFAQDAIGDILEQPQGYGPGSAGLVAISNPQGGVLTENYYLQIAYEIGWLGLALFITILLIIYRGLQKIVSSHSPAAQVLLASMLGYLFYSLFIHLWSNEAVALQWWLLAGALLGTIYREQNKRID